MARKQCVPSRATAKLRNRAPSASTMRAVASRDMLYISIGMVTELPVNRTSGAADPDLPWEEASPGRRKGTQCSLVLIIDLVKLGTPGVFNYSSRDLPILRGLSIVMEPIDCSSLDTAMTSVSKLFGVDADHLLDVMIGIDLNKMYEDHRVDGRADKELFSLLEQKLGRKVILPREAYWFHLTRVLRTTTFEEGILPLRDALPMVWNTFRSIVPNGIISERLEGMRKGRVDNFQYNHKLGQPNLGGPFAMLVRESAFRAQEMRNHDYLRIPEIIEDVCRGYERTFGEPILNEVEAKLHRCIVTFRSTLSEGMGCDCARAAAYYVYSSVWGEKLSIEANTCYSGDGNGVPPKDIMAVDFIDDH